MPTNLDTIVIGAGQAGLAAGYHLQRAGLRFAILEASTRPDGSWPHYYASLELFSPARFSSLPGLPFPGDPERYPTRDEVIAYLRQYAAHFQLPIIGGARVAQVTQHSAGFQVQTTDGVFYHPRSVIAASGAFHRPNMPELPGQSTFRGNLLHSAEYCKPEPFHNQRVIVVGGGNSAVQIGVELAQVARVTLATREPIKFRSQRILGRDIHFWWWLTQVDRLPLTIPIGYWTGLLVSGAVLDTGVYQAALAAGRPDRQPMFKRFTAEGIVWDDGSEEAVDTVIFATGYRQNLDYLASLGALDDEGQARQHFGISQTTPGLYYVGLEDQRTYASATLRGVGPDAAYILKHLCRYLRASPDLQPAHR